MTIMLLLRCVAWLLVFTCLTVAGVPVSTANDTTTSSPGINATSIVGVLHLNSTQTSNVSVIPLNPKNKTSTSSVNATALNVTQNGTSIISVNVTTINITQNGPSAISVNATINITQNGTSTLSVTPGLGGSTNDSAETLEELQGDDAEEGDIMMTKDRNAVKTIWSGGVIPYVVSPELAHRQMDIEEAFRMIMSVTCIRFVQHTNEFNYIEIKDGKGCASFVGCQGGDQPVYFAETCSAGNLCHELMHAAGLYHEHTRHDRDQHVIVNWGSIRPDRKRNFKVKKGNTLNLPYDLESIMHYGVSYFSVDGGHTLQPLQPGVSIGQRSHLSPLDASKLNALYHCGVKGLI